MRQIKEKEYEAFEQYLYNKERGYIWTPDMLDFICRANEYDSERIGKQMLEILTRYRNEHITFMRNDKNWQYVIRTLRSSETKLLKDFLYEAIYIPEGTAPPSREILEKPELRVYTDDFGTRNGDNCLVADFGGKVVGAVWSRIMNDYGHIDDDTPSLAISIYKEYRKQGVGSQLLVKMLDLLKWKGYERVSLSVQKANPAVKMYRDFGFKTVAEKAEEYIMSMEF
nr:GNAT family N-acetyltransferase [Lachnospiraceae bacterium]